MPKLWPSSASSLIVLLITLAFTLFVLVTNYWNPMAFVRLGTRYGQGDPNGTIGYDGQFAYQIALNPREAAPYLDIPAYRYQRILYPLTARAISLGQPKLIPWALISLNILALTVGTYGMGLILAQQRLSRWYALPVGLFVGQLVSLRLDLNEPFSLTFAIMGVYTFEMGRSRWGAFFLALSMLSKETAIAFVAGYLIYFFLRQKWRLLIETGLISLGPFAIWQLGLWLRFGQLGLRSGGAGATAFSLIPFGGLLAFGLDSLERFVSVVMIVGPLVVLPSVAFMIVLLYFFRRSDMIPVALVLSLHIVMMATLPFSTYVDLPGLLRLTSGLVVATILFAALIRSRKILNYSLLWIASLAYLRFFI